MAAETVKSALLAVIDKTSSQSPRSCKLREWGKQILEKSQSEEESFDTFSIEVVLYLQGIVSSTATKYKLSSSKREHLWKKISLDSNEK